MGEQHGFFIQIEVIEPGSYSTGLKSVLRMADEFINENGGEAAVLVKSTGDSLYTGTPAAVAFCEGCEGHIYPGVRWPTKANDDDSHQWVERCDTCERYDSDDAAAEHLREVYAGSGATYALGEARPTGSCTTTPFFDLES